MQVWLKLLVSYLVVIGGMLIISVGGIRSAREVRDRFHDVNDEAIPLLMHLKDLRYSGMRVASLTMEYSFLSGLGSAHGKQALAREREEEKRILKAGFAAYHTELSSCAKFMNPVPEERKLFLKIDAAGTRFLAVARNFILLRDMNAPSDRLLEAKDEFESAENAFLTAVNNGLAFERQEVAEQEGFALAAVSRAMTTTAALSVTVLLLSIGVAVAVAFSISRRLLLLRNAAQVVAAGNLDFTVPVTSHDEIGSLFHSFNRMVDSLRSSKQGLATLNGYLQSMIATIPDALIVVSREGDILDANPAAEVILGYPRKELLSVNFTRLFCDRVCGDGFLLKIRQSGEVIEEEYLFQTPQEVEIAVSLSASILHCGDENGRFLCVCRDVTHRKNAEREIHQLAYFDSLTGLPNRTLFLDRCNHALALARRTDHKQLVLFFFDLDHFKDLNDTLGHDAGDHLLKLVAERLSHIVRSVDTLARLGGDEFVLLCTSLSGTDDASTLAEKLLHALGEPFQVESREIFTNASMGIVVYPQDGTDTHTLLKNADLAMYAAKERGRHNFQFFSDDLNRKAQERTFIEEGLRQALQQMGGGDGELLLHYQPQIALDTGAVVGVEALARWIHPTKGFIGPDRFIAVAEATGLIRELGGWVLHTACAQCKRWHRLGHRITVAVNVSVLQLADPGFAAQVESALVATGLDPAFLELELTESKLMGNAAECAAVLKELKALGVKIAIDDFGTGYSSLSYLKDFDVDRLKIDRSFVREIASRADAAAITKAIIAIGHTLGLRVVAEGIETAQEEEMLLQYRCDDAQGYYYAKPMTVTDLDFFLAGKGTANVIARLAKAPGAAGMPSLVAAGAGLDSESVSDSVSG